MVNTEPAAQTLMIKIHMCKYSVASCFGFLLIGNHGN